MKKLFFLLLLLPMSLSSQQRWTKLDTGLLTISTQLLVIDWGQSIDIARQRVNCPERYGTCYPESWHRWTEGNFLLGKHPSVGRVNTYILSVITLNTVAYRLPPRWRRVVWSSVTALEIYTVVRNHRSGIRLNFHF